MLLKNPYKFEFLFEQYRILLLYKILLFLHLFYGRRIVWRSLAILILEVAIVIYQKKNSSLNAVELWVTKETDESEVQSALRKYQQQGIFVCIFRSGTKDCAELTQELLRMNLT